MMALVFTFFPLEIRSTPKPDPRLPLYFPQSLLRPGTGSLVVKVC